ncbi:MAG: acyl-CoA thioesterase, partial [Flavobacteriaceae bacterium]|nr:acyl-CoA thioesterase [Flavobacteriaceae bacterium]
ISYKKPAKYDELLSLKTTLLKLPAAKIEFDFELFGETGELLTKAYVSLVFIDIAKNRPVKAPELILEKLSAYF